jgi:hypothetical protein
VAFIELLTQADRKLLTRLVVAAEVHAKAVDAQTKTLQAFGPALALIADGQQRSAVALEALVATASQPPDGGPPSIEFSAGPVREQSHAPSPISGG